MIGVVRVVTLEDEDLLAAHGNVIFARYGLQTISRCIPNQPYGVHDDYTERVATPKIIEVGMALAEQGVEAVVVSCAADPAVSELRTRLSIPVIGAGSAAALVARGLGQRVGVLGITEHVPPVIETELEDLLVGYARPDGVVATTDLLTEFGRQSAIQAAESLLAGGAQTIVFACTGFTTIGLAQTLRNKFACAVVDAVEAEGLLAWYACRGADRMVEARV
ncbi:MAG: aspartate/glutamate racemase family protein [Alicyclobacillus sp.]|nr:aspartate/glutamate racemase family protein [Alicyclobacillus sp.]